MATIILVVLFVIFANIFAYNPECEKELYCECLKYNTNVSNIVNVHNKNVTFSINVKSWSNIQIECGDISWNAFYLRQIKNEGVLDLIVFKNCTLPEETRLQYFVRKLGIKETNGLGFQSYRNLSNSLKKNHFLGFRFLNKLDLSHNGLTDISSDLFSNLPNLESLDLSENSLVLRKDFFNETLNLKQLDLNGNGITELAADSFDNLQGLEILNLERNLLKELDDVTFDKLTSLKYLNLRSNLLSDLPELIFSGLKNLETIDLSNNNFSSFPVLLFIGNKKLQKIIINDNKARLTTMTDELLNDLKNLEEVYLNRNGFDSLPENLFLNSTSLKYIDFSENLITKLPENIFKDLENVEKISMCKNLITTLPDKIFKYVKKLKILDLSFNRISNVQRNLFNGLTLLRVLNMEGNDLTNINRAAFSTNKVLSIAKFSNNMLQFDSSNETLSPFYNNRLLTELHLANNRIKDFFRDWSMNKAELELLDLSYNNISVISTDDFVFWKHKVMVNLSNNNISKIFLNNIESSAKRNLENRHFVIDVKNNPLLCDCNLFDLLRYCNNDMSITVYNFVELRLGNLTCVQPDGTQGPQINQLNFKTYKCLDNEFFKSHKNCQTKCTCYIRPYDKVRILDCSYKNISVFHIDRNEINFSQRYPLILNFTGNNLTKLPDINTSIALNVKGLLLSDNKISELSVYSLPESLTILELHNNNISSLNQIVISYLTHLPLTELTLSGNPIICDCYAKHLLRLILALQHSHKDLENVKCRNTDIALRSITSIDLCIHTSIVLD